MNKYMFKYTYKNINNLISHTHTQHTYIYINFFKTNVLKHEFY